MLSGCLMLGLTSCAAAQARQKIGSKRTTGRPGVSGPRAPGSLALISLAVQEAIRERRCPGAVVVIGHAGG